MQSLISVIIPVYQVVNYLEKCIDSVLKQSYNNLEIILVDDGSTDGGEKVCDQYAEDDKRIKVIHQSNQGPSSARNAGVKVATGDYLFFVDSDDILPSHAIEILHDAMKERQVDIALGKYIRFNCNRHLSFDKKVIDILSEDHKKQLQKLYIGKEQMKAFFDDSDYPAMVWGKLYRRELFENIRFPVGRLYCEDEYTTYKLLDHSKSSIFIPEVVYEYRDNPDGITHRKYNANTIQSFETIDEQVKFVHEKYPECEEAAKCKLVFSATRCGLWLLQSRKSFDKDEQIYQNAIRQHIKLFLFKGKNRLHTKIFAIMYAYTPRLLKALFAITRREI